MNKIGFAAWGIKRGKDFFVGFSICQCIHLLNFKRAGLNLVFVTDNLIMVLGGNFLLSKGV